MKHQIRRTLTERAHHVELLKSGSYSQAEYSRLTGISVSVLRYWILGDKKKMKDSIKPEGSFVPVELEGEPISLSEIIVEFPKGIRVTLRGRVEASYIRLLLG